MSRQRCFGAKERPQHDITYEFRLGSKIFQVTADLADLMMQGNVYAIYYIQGSEKEILSAEFISKAN